MKAITCRTYGVLGDSSNRWIGPIGRMVAAAAFAPFVRQRMTSFTVQPNQRDLALTELVERGQVALVLNRTLALGEVVDAIRHVEGGHIGGNTIVTTTRS